MPVKKFDELLEKYGFSPKYFFGISIRELDDKKLKAIAHAGDVFQPLQVMFSNYKGKAFGDLMGRQIQSDVNDVTDRLQLAQDVVTYKVFYTLANLDKVAKAELDRRRQQKKETSN